MLTYDAVAFVAEQKILEAQEEGAFDNLPGTGKPLVTEDLSHLPPEMRMAYTLLKNSGFMEARTERAHAAPPGKELRQSAPETGEKQDRLRRLDVMLRRVCRARGQEECLPPLLDSPYLEKLLKHI